MILQKPPYENGSYGCIIFFDLGATYINITGEKKYSRAFAFGSGSGLSSDLGFDSLDAHKGES